MLISKQSLHACLKSGFSFSPPCYCSSNYYHPLEKKIWSKAARWCFGPFKEMESWRAAMCTACECRASACSWWLLSSQHQQETPCPLTNRTPSFFPIRKGRFLAKAILQIHVFTSKYSFNLNAPSEKKSQWHLSTWSYVFYTLHQNTWI